mgnify:CR=1 FL=1
MLVGLGGLLQTAAHVRAIAAAAGEMGAGSGDVAHVGAAPTHGSSSCRDIAGREDHPSSHLD